MSPRALASTLPKVTKAVLQKHGSAYAALIAEWPNIVGLALSESTLPEKLTAATPQRAGGSLTVRVAGAAATELQHLAPQIIERINTFLGFAAIARLKLVQAPLPGRQPPPKRPMRRVTPAARDAIASRTAEIEQPALREALIRLGEAIAAEEPAPPGKSR